MTETAIINELPEPFASAMTPEVARELSNLKVSPETQSRIDKLAQKCNEGTLSEDERQAYETYVRVGNLFTVLRAKARMQLGNGHDE